MDNSKYEYFAFISYSSQDLTFAKRFQEHLERYHVPTKIREQNPELPQNIRPVFRDGSDISTGELKSVLQKYLRESKYLIVICSEASAASRYVNQEVEYFCSLGREERIIPLIISGKPDDPVHSCYPPALKRSIIGANVNEDGYRKAFIRVVASILGVSNDSLWQRDLRRRRKNNILLAVFLSVILGAVGSYTYYYQSIYLPRLRFYSEDHVGQKAIFGRYEQDNDTENGPESIEWTILDQYDDESFLLIAEHSLDAVPYHENRTDITWENSTLRAWLNESFYEKAFTKEEQDKILLSNIQNKSNPQSGADGGEDTQDYVYLLSISEAQKYYGEHWQNVDGCFGSSDLVVEATDYAIAQGAHFPQPDEFELACYEIGGTNYPLSEKATSWWLRSPGGKTDLAAYVFWYGSVDAYSNRYYPDSKEIGVRPVIRAHLVPGDVSTAD